MTVAAVFGSWNAGLALAGLEVRTPNEPRERCPQGHELVDENVFVCNDGRRLCLACKRKRDRDGMRRWRSQKRGREQRRQRNRQAARARKRELYAERRAAGLCNCGSPRDLPGGHHARSA